MFKSVGGFIFLVIVFAAAVLAITLKLYVIGSVVTSGIKSVSGKCGTTYPVERVLSGDWFCETKGN